MTCSMLGFGGCGVTKKHIAIDLPADLLQVGPIIAVLLRASTPCHIFYHQISFIEINYHSFYILNHIYSFGVFSQVRHQAIELF